MLRTIVSWNKVRFVICETKGQELTIECYKLISGDNYLGRYTVGQ